MKDAHFYDEEHYFQTRKEQRLDRKLASKLDRSQFKKTDLKKKKQLEKPVLPEEKLLMGVVTHIQGQKIRVQVSDQTYLCSLRGVFKKNKSKAKRTLVVGDHVFLEEQHPLLGVIVSIKERRSVLSRADHLSQVKEHPIAANIDIVFIVTSVIDPPLRPAIIDRYVIAAAKGSMTPVLVINKIDLLENGPQEEKELFSECLSIYRSLGIEVIATSCSTQEGISSLAALMKGKISVFSGQSGSGKSSLINAVCGLTLKVGKTVQRSKKGAHTTSLAQLLPLTFGGYVVDTPGIKSFGIWNLSKDEVKHYFSEIWQEGKHCAFQDCLHRGEVGCAIPQAVNDGKVSPRRYASYLNILDTIESEHLRR